jgi:flagellar secretion chaperone FliS
MQSSANANQYLTTEVFTAPPQKLQLMLIQAAIRMVTRAQQHWQSAEVGQAGLVLVQAQEIVEQLIRGVNREACPDLADRVLAVYTFIARCLREALQYQDEKKLADAVRVLNVERETWRQLCEQLGGSSDARNAEFISTAAKSPVKAPFFDSLGELPASGFSLEV